MSTRPLHRPALATPGRYGGIAPVGLPCPEHASMTVDGRCYQHAKVAHLTGESVSLEARQWVGFDLPQPKPRWSTDRGWRSAEDVVRTVTRDDEEREAQVRGIRYLMGIGDERAELSV